MRAFRVGIAGPVGSGKTALVDCLSKRLWPGLNLGVVTNDMCGAKDASAAKAECTSKCVKSHGAKYALYDEADKKVYILEPQDKADGHAGHDVTVKGTLDGDTIHVTSLTMNTAKGS